MLCGSNVANFAELQSWVPKDLKNLMHAELGKSWKICRILLVVYVQYRMWHAAAYDSMFHNSMPIEPRLRWLISIGPASCPLTMPWHASIISETMHPLSHTQPTLLGIRSWTISKVRIPPYTICSYSFPESWPYCFFCPVYMENHKWVYLDPNPIGGLFPASRCAAALLDKAILTFL